jgi:CRP/FNR family cyclic AMP-dependent transcriptional regulator
MDVEQDKYDILDILSKSPWFAELPQSALEKLAQAGQIKHYKSTEYLYQIGEKTTALYCLLKGRLRISMSSHLGQEFALTDLDAEYWLGEASLMGDEARIQEAQLQTEADILSIPRSVIVEVAEEFPLLYRNLFAENIRRSRKVYELLGAMVFYPLKARLAGRLIDLVSDHGVIKDNGVLLNIQLSQNDFARLCFGSRQRVNKIFREWVERGLLEMQGDHYMIFDIDGIKSEINIEES